MKNITIIIFIIIAVILPSDSFALDDIGYSRIHPASPLYFLKAVREKLELHFAATYRVRMIRQLEFATRRLRETKTLIAKNKEELIPPTMERYIAHLHSLTDKHQKNDEFEIVTQNTLPIHLAVLQKIYHQAATPRAKIAIRSVMNRIIQRADVPNDAKLPVCNFFTKEASSSGLNQTEQVVLQQRAQKCFDSLR